MTTKISPKPPIIYECTVCSVVCSRKSEWLRHLNTMKHKNKENGEIGNVLPTTVTHNCECGKNYKDRGGLWRHKKKCVTLIYDKNNTNSILSLVKQNNDFKDLIIEQNKVIMELCKEKSIVNNNVNSNNKTFNLNMFLNEQCKDAMNIMDFIDSLKLQISDLENVGKLGFVEGISDIIVKNLKALDIEKRPVHCTDSKREVMYVKDDNQWYKEEDNNKKLRKAIKHIANKNAKLISEFKAKYPDCIYSDSKKSDQYNKIIIEAFGGSKNEDKDNENKIIKKIAREVIIEKKIGEKSVV